MAVETPAPAVVVLGARGMATARRAAAALDGARVHGLARRADGADETFDCLRAHLAALFDAGVPIVGVCAAGILIRTLAPLLGDKTAEPPVLALSDDGACAVPLLGGHRGANRLARRLARAFGGAAAVTSASDARFGVSLDEPPPGWTLANPENAKEFAAALLGGARVRMAGPAADPPPWLAAGALPFDGSGALAIEVSDRRGAAAPNTLLYRPRRLALGVGCERGAAPEAAIALAEAVLDAAGADESALACVASLDLKADEAAVHAVAERFDAPARFFPAAQLEEETPRLANPSPTVFRAVGCHGVAEAAALAATGAGGRLAVAKRIAGAVTCALARAPAPVDPETVGAPRGRLTIVGIGPGDPRWRTAEAEEALARAEDVVGYGGYLDLLGAPRRGQRRHAFPLGAEEARARCALDLAAQGRRVALVSSGDPGIYAMAALVFECLDRAGRADWRRAGIVVAPGVSALQAAAARAGAPLGHDFCAISLSDLLTPWATIEKRLRAAAGADFAVALYNPVSARRRGRLDRARDCLLTARAPGTPVTVARNLGRDGETVRRTALAALSEADADMLTVVIVGATTTRTVAGADWVYTPRGYAVAR